MAIIGRFIGVGKYIDPGARELPGARRDALALWSLFSDSLPEADMKLLLDSEGTTTAIRESLNQTLDSATTEDVVIFYFSGHGSRDHRLITYNTTKETYGDTAIPMVDLATQFKLSKAKIILCVLDCCFSGGAPARILEDTPITREHDTSIKSFAGEGRIFIAASDFNEISYEIPTTGHGIFTKALLDVLKEQVQPQDIQVLTSRVMEVVRVESEKLKLKQTPVVCGQVTGGLIIPLLKPGKNYFKFFPEASGVNISSKIDELAGFGLPQEIWSVWAAKFENGLNELQLQAINEHRILDGNSLMVIAPTSSGKTFIGELAAAQAIVSGNKAVFLLPYKALVNEKFEDFSALYGQRLQMRVIRCSGDNSDQVSLFLNGKYDIAVLTYEMFLGLSISNPAILNNIGLVVIDESQFVTNPTRGIVIELILTQLITARENGVKPQLVTLSATIGDVNYFGDWLGINVLKTDKRPVPLVEGVIDRNGTFQYLDLDGSEKTMELVPRSEIRIRKSTASSQDVIVPLTRKLIDSDKDEKIIIFRNKRGSAEGCANYLSEELNLPPAEKDIRLLSLFDPSQTSDGLKKCLSGGTAFHNTNLTREQRVIVEKAFKASGEVKVLAATTTVAAGVNTPASTVIIVEHEFPGQKKQPYTVSEYKNMAGRAGRLGYKKQGMSILYD